MGATGQEQFILKRERAPKEQQQITHHLEMQAVPYKFSQFSLAVLAYRKPETPVLDMQRQQDILQMYIINYLIENNIELPKYNEKVWLTYFSTEMRIKKNPLRSPQVIQILFSIFQVMVLERINALLHTRYRAPVVRMMFLTLTIRRYIEVINQEKSRK